MGRIFDPVRPALTNGRTVFVSAISGSKLNRVGQQRKARDRFALKLRLRVRSALNELVKEAVLLEQV